VTGTVTFIARSRFTALLHMCQTTRRHIPKDTFHCLGAHYPKLPFSSHRYICVTTEAQLSGQIALHHHKSRYFTTNRVTSPQIALLHHKSSPFVRRFGRSRNADWILGRGNSRRRYSGKIMKLTTQLHLVPK